MLPLASRASDALKRGDYGDLVIQVLRLAVPNTYIWLTMFFNVFHAYVNLLSELTRFADQLFYHDWWNSHSLGDYWRKWNLPVHNYMLRHVYFPLRRRKVPRFTCLIIVFVISAIFHEYIVSS